MEQTVNLTLRLPREVRDWLRGLSSRNNRSMNSQLVCILQERQAQTKENAPELRPSEALDSIPNDQSKETEHE